MNGKSDKKNPEIWYNTPAEEQDVIVSTRIRLARNLASFPFPSNFKNDDSLRVQNIIFDAFSKFENPENYQLMALKNVDSNAEKILSERGLYNCTTGTGLITTLDGVSSCIVNDVEHVKISSFASGLNLKNAFQNCRKIDDEMQQFVQFAASKDFGYLNSSIFDTGSGMKVSLRLHLPALSYSGDIKDVIKEFQLKGFIFSDCFGVGSFFDSSVGAYYQISTSSCFNGNEIDQMAQVTSAAKYICDLERKKRAYFIDNKSTVIHNIVVKSFALAKFSILLTVRDCIDIISCLKWGLDSGYIAGIEDYELNSLLYRVQSGHLGYMMNTGSFSFEQDIESDSELKEQRFRAIVLKSVIEKISFVS